MHAMDEIVSRERQQPRDYGEQSYSGRQLTCRVPSRLGTQRELDVAARQILSETLRNANATHQSIVDSIDAAAAEHSRPPTGRFDLRQLEVIFRIDQSVQLQLRQQLIQLHLATGGALAFGQCL